MKKIKKLINFLDNSGFKKEARFLRKEALGLSLLGMIFGIGCNKAEDLVLCTQYIEYEVKKGDYIQIIDLYGRQCSDFMAFDSKALQKGKEYSIDTTVSRAIHAGSYPMPGLHSKYFDKNFDTLIEVVQDTIGRHDTFGTACTQKLYEQSVQRRVDC